MVPRSVVVGSTRARYALDISVGPHLLRADEPYDSGGNDAGPNSYELLLAALGACSMPVVSIPDSGNHATAVSLYAAIVTGLYQRERTGKGCNVSTSLIANGAWATAGWLQAGLFGAKFTGEIDRKNPPNALAGESYRTSDNRWLLLCFVEEDKNWPVFVKAIERADLQGDARFADSKNRRANSSALVAELDALFATQSLAYWKNVLDAARLPYGVVQIPEEIVKDPQLFENRIVVPIDDGSASPKYTVDSPLTVKDSPKVAPRRAPSHGEHTNEVLLEIGFDKPAVEAVWKSGVVSAAHKQEPSAAA